MLRCGPEEDWLLDCLKRMGLWDSRSALYVLGGNDDSAPADELFRLVHSFRMSSSELPYRHSKPIPSTLFIPFGADAHLPHRDTKWDMLFSP